MTPPPSIKGVGSIPSNIAIVTEYATADDIWRGYPLAGNSGTEFSKMLHEARITLTSCYRTPVLKYRAPGDNPSRLYSTVKKKAQEFGLTEVVNGTYTTATMANTLQELASELQQVSPRVIIALGDFAMWALTGIYGSVDTWRGSHLECNLPGLSHVTVIPTYTPAYIFKMWQVRGFAVRDLQRAQAISETPALYSPPAYQFHTQPTYDQVMSILHSLLDQAKTQPTPLLLANDIETIARHISCIGLAWNVREALCIPFMTLDGHYWTEAQEISIMELLKELCTHPNVEGIGQNFNYDSQHYAKHYGFIPNCPHDTMIAQHVLFPGIPKSLDFLSSMYCHWHRYWKDEINDYNRLPENMQEYWTYNCKDVCVTFEVWNVLQGLLTYLNRQAQYDFLYEVSLSALNCMLRGIRVNQEARSKVAGRLMEVISEYDQLINEITGIELNVGSPAQMKKFFYDDLRLPIQLDRKTRKPTCSAKALQKIAEKEALVKPLCDLIEKRRSVGVFLSTFCLMPLDSDGRMRCSFNVCGTETFRFSSSTNAFGSGGNLQNIPKGEEE